MLVNKIGETIKYRRKELGITQPHLAELAKISTNTLYKLERGQGNPSLKVLTKLADVLGLFLCHLCIEKAIKAHVVRFTGNVPPKVHNLSFLL